MKSSSRMFLSLAFLLSASSALSQYSGLPIAVDLGSSFTIQYSTAQPSQCYRVPRPADGRITATVSGPGTWDVCIGDQQCPSNCSNSGQRTASTEPYSGGSFYFVRVISRTPGTAATLSFYPTAASAAATTVGGTWTVVFKGQTTTTMTLEQSGNVVTGNLVTTDGTPGAVTGTLNGSTLTLSRDTGRNTIQHYQVTVQGDSFSGTYRNQGKISDSGTFAGTRSSGTGGYTSQVARRGRSWAAAVAGTWTVVLKGQVTTTMTLEQSGENVTGSLVTADGTSGALTGKFAGSTLTLTRNTGLNTTQYYQATVQGDSFSGTYRNEGRIVDSGTFTGTRTAGGGGISSQIARRARSWVANVSGTWEVVFKGQARTTMTLEQSGETVTGNLVTTDGTPGAVSGTFSGSTLTLARNTGRNTTQHYQVTVQGDSFSGTYRNEGRISDSGTFTGTRTAGGGGIASQIARSAQSWVTNVAGTWTVVFKGQVSTTMTLEQSGETVTGNLVTADGTAGAVSGKLSGSTLTLSRNTGLDTIQYYQATVEGDSFSGTYRNEGRIPDSGTFTGTRTAGGSQAWMTTVAGTWSVVFKGQVTTTMTLEQSGETVTGTMVTTDGTPGYLTGKLSGATLTLSRNTGRDTIQYYQVTVQGNSFSGNYYNQGRYPDSGTFTGQRR